MKSASPMFRFKLQALVALVGLAASLGLGACGRSASVTDPMAGPSRDGSEQFAKGGVKGKPSPPAAPTLSSPANGALDVVTNPTLVWNASTGAASYGVQLSTSSTFATTVVNVSGVAGTSFAVSGLANSTQYFWRVNARNAGGTSAFSSAFSFTTAAAAGGGGGGGGGTAPATPVLNSPVNGAVDVSVNPSLTWLASTGATEYRVQVATNSAFTAPLVSDVQGLASTSLALSGLANSTQYFWRVAASNINGSSAFSSPFSFTTVAVAPPPPAGGACASLAGLGGTVTNVFADVVQFRPGNRLRVEIQGDVAGGVINTLGPCSTTDPVTVTWPAGGTGNVKFAGTTTSINGGTLTFGELLFPGALLEPGVVVASDAVGNVLEIIWPEIAGLGVGAPILRLQLAQWDPSVISGTHLDCDMVFIARAADGTTASFAAHGNNLIVP